MRANRNLSRLMRNNINMICSWLCRMHSSAFLLSFLRDDSEKMKNLYSLHIHGFGNYESLMVPIPKNIPALRFCFYFSEFPFLRGEQYSTSRCLASLRWELPFTWASRYGNTTLSLPGPLTWLHSHKASAQFTRFVHLTLFSRAMRERESNLF